MTATQCSPPPRPPAVINSAEKSALLRRQDSVDELRPLLEKIELDGVIIPEKLNTGLPGEVPRSRNGIASQYAYAIAGCFGFCSRDTDDGSVNMHELLGRPASLLLRDNALHVQTVRAMGIEDCQRVMKSPPTVQWVKKDGFNSVHGKVEQCFMPGGNDFHPEVRFLGRFDSAEECADACLASQHCARVTKGFTWHKPREAGGTLARAADGCFARTCWAAGEAGGKPGTLATHTSWVIA